MQLKKVQWNKVPSVIHYRCDEPRKLNVNPVEKEKKKKKDDDKIYTQ